MMSFEEFKLALVMINGLFAELGQISVNPNPQAKGFRAEALRHLDELYQRVLTYPGAVDNAGIVATARAVRIALEGL